jgi:peptidoglycan/xylan/chitin deacetylase (PgdA/CDA1 family)
MEALLAGLEGTELPPNPVLITFDDGYRSCREIALPILEGFGVPAAFFIATEFNFVGHEDEWKRKWTDRAHENVALAIYRDTPVGLARYALHLARPHLPAALRGGVRTILPRGCQRNDIIGAHKLLARVRGRLDAGLGIKSGTERRLHRSSPSGSGSA